MSRRARFWLVIAAISVLVNLAGGVYAGLQGEVAHAGVHVVLFVLTVYLVRRLAPRHAAAHGPRVGRA